MTGEPPTLPDPTTLIRQLDPDSIRDRIQTIDRERDALMVLLRAAIRARPKAARAKAVPGAR